MSDALETGPSLLFRLREGDDESAWEEFVAINRTVIVRLAKDKGLQNCDAEDLAQQVLISISKSIPKWEHDTLRARFRTATSHEATRKISRHDPAPLTRFNLDLPDWFERFVMRLLEKEPANRYNSAEEVATLLQACLAHSEQPHLTALPELQAVKPNLKARNVFFLLR